MPLLAEEKRCLRILGAVLGCWGLTAFLAAENLTSYEALPAAIAGAWLVGEGARFALSRRRRRSGKRDAPERD
jgi:hypothetical protein